MQKKYIGDKAFYRRVLAIAIPIIIQNGITHFVSLLDNIMVGQLGDPQMSGVSIANQLIMIANLCMFGATSGAGIFTAQFRGNDDEKGIRYTFRYKFLILLSIAIASVLFLIPLGQPLIQMFLKGDGSIVDAGMTLGFGEAYLQIMLIGLVPFAIANIYTSTLREYGETKIPMLAGVFAVLTNLILNYILIFGHFGAPAMGVEGAAIATVVSRFVELGFLAIWTHTHPEKYPFIKGAYKSLYVPGKLVWNISKRGLPLVLNETLWAIGIAWMNQSYSICGLDVVNAVNITSTINNLASVVTMAMGATIGIIMGHNIGSGMEKEEIFDINRKLLAFCVAMGFVFAGFLAAFSGLFPKLYNTSESIRRTATGLILILAAIKPLHTYTYCAYFSIRAGGNTWTTFLYDGGFMMAVSVPVAFALTRFTSLTIFPVYILSQGVDLIKAFLGFCVLRKGNWANRITEKT